jgi:hypothetical protein
MDYPDADDRDRGDRGVLQNAGFGLDVYNQDRFRPASVMKEQVRGGVALKGRS